MTTYSRVLFKVKAETKLGEKVHLGGENWALGGFKPLRAIELVTTPEEYPIWRTPKRINLATGKNIEYKFAIFSGGEFQQWEPIDQHSRVITPEGMEMDVFDTFGGVSQQQAGDVDAQQPNPDEVKRDQDSVSSETSNAGPSNGDDPDVPEHRNLKPPGVELLDKPTPYSYGYTASPPHIFYERAPPASSPPTAPEAEQPALVAESAPVVETSRGDVKADQNPSPSRLTQFGKHESDVKQSNRHTVFLVSFHLPVVLSFDNETSTWSAKWDSDNIVAKTESSIANDNDVVWIGAITHTAVSDAAKERVCDFDEETQDAIRKVLAPMKCHPLFMDKGLYENAYASYCKSKLRNVFHNVLELETEAERTSDKGTFESYIALNRFFAQAVITRLNRSITHDVVWVHDYHLMLLPKMIRDGVLHLNQNLLKQKQSTPGQSGTVADDLSTDQAKRIQRLHSDELIHESLKALDSSTSFGMNSASSFAELTSMDASVESLVATAATEESAPSNALPDTEKGYPEPRIVFFLHIPFPTSEIFRTLTSRNEILQGILSANVVGFHTFGHARHFLTACKRFLGFQYHSRKGGTLMVDQSGRSVLIAVSHVGIEPHKLDELMNDPEVIQAAKKLRSQHRGKIIIAGYDHLERLKGVPLKLLAFEKLMSECHRYRNRIVFVQHGIKGRSRSMDSIRSTAEVKQLVSRIIHAHGPVVEYKEHDLDADVKDRVALWLAADVMISCPVMEGLNLFPLEYQYVHRDPAGVVILSEFSANSSVLNGAIRVNSYDISDIANALDKAIRMPVAEREARRERDFKYIASRKSSLWTREILKEVESSVRKSDEIITAIDHDEAVGSETVVSVQHRMDVAECTELNRNMVLEAYRNSKRRLILLDYGGTICEREHENLAVKVDFLGVSKRKLSPRVVEIVKRLSADPRNAVFIVSGNSRTVLSANFKEVLQEDKNIGLVAHSGLCIRWGHIGDTERNEPEQQGTFSNDVASLGPMHRSITGAEEFPPHMDSAVRTAEQQFKEEGWEMVLKGIAQEWSEWMNAARIPDLLEDITWHTGGSVWRQSPVTTIWDFRQADPEQGGMQANALQAKLEEAIQSINVPVAIVRKKNTVQLMPRGVSKGTAVKHILERLPEKWGGDVPDFVICMGDDVADELMFTQVLDSLSEGEDAHLYRPFRHDSVDGEVVREIFTVTVGRKPTEARYYVNDVGEVLNILGLLATESMVDQPDT